MTYRTIMLPPRMPGLSGLCTTQDVDAGAPEDAAEEAYKLSHARGSRTILVSTPDYTWAFTVHSRTVTTVEAA